MLDEQEYIFCKVRDGNIPHVGEIIFWGDQKKMFKKCTGLCLKN